MHVSVSLCVWTRKLKELEGWNFVYIFYTKIVDLCKLLDQNRQREDLSIHLSPFIFEHHNSKTQQARLIKFGI